MANREVIESLREKVSRLIGENERLGKETAALARQKDSFARENRALKVSVAELEKRVKVLELGETLGGGNVDTRVAKARINRLMREIDKCIALMNR